MTKTTQEFPLKEGVETLIELVKEKCDQQEGSVVVLVAGGSASGKTSAVAAKVTEAFGDEAALISMDDYYRGWTYLQSEIAKGNEIHWDMPEAVHIEKIKEHLESLKQGKSINKPIFSFEKREPINEEEVVPKSVLVVEGLFALHEDVKDVGDILVFVDAGLHGRMMRRILRDIERAKEHPTDILRCFLQIVEPAHEEYIQNTKQFADIVIDNDYKAVNEADRSGLIEMQVKYQGEIDEDLLRTTEAVLIEESEQEDVYYAPKDRDLIKTGEMLRIRKEGETYRLTYKGPRSGTHIQKRPRFEFEIDEEIRQLFVGCYGKEAKVVKKRRRTYELNGVRFSLDKVAVKERGEEKDLGSFVEIRSLYKNHTEQTVTEVVKALGLESKETVNQTYFEM